MAIRSQHRVSLYAIRATSSGCNSSSSSSSNSSNTSVNINTQLQSLPKLSRHPSDANEMSTLLEGNSGRDFRVDEFAMHELNVFPFISRPFHVDLCPMYGEVVV